MRSIRSIAILSFSAVALLSCHSSRELSKNSGFYRTLYAGLTPTADVIRLRDTVKVIFPEVSMFDFSKDEVKPEVKPKFIRFASILKNHPNVRILINGYTDNVGAVETNNDLSRRRAVKAYNLLSDNGVDAARMNTTGYGPLNPIQSNDSESGRAANRRVEFMLYTSKS